MPEAKYPEKKTFTARPNRFKGQAERSLADWITGRNKSSAISDLQGGPTDQNNIDAYGNNTPRIIAQPFTSTNKKDLPVINQMNANMQLSRLGNQDATDKMILADQLASKGRNEEASLQYKNAAQLAKDKADEAQLKQENDDYDLGSAIGQHPNKMQIYKDLGYSDDDIKNGDLDPIDVGNKARYTFGNKLNAGVTSALTSANNDTSLNEFSNNNQDLINNNRAALLQQPAIENEKNRASITEENAKTSAMQSGIKQSKTSLQHIGAFGDNGQMFQDSDGLIHVISAKKDINNLNAPPAISHQVLDPVTGLFKNFDDTTSNQPTFNKPVLNSMSDVDNAANQPVDYSTAFGRSASDDFEDWLKAQQQKQ